MRREEPAIDHYRAAGNECGFRVVPPWGRFTTVAFLPLFIQHIAAAVPSSYAVEGLREALFYAAMPSPARNLTVLIASGALSLLAGIAMLARPKPRAGKGVQFANATAPRSPLRGRRC